MPAFLRSVSFLGLFWVATALAGPREFVPPEAMTPEQEAYLKSKGNADLKRYLNQMPEDKPIPWRGILLALATLGAAVPFALRAFRETVSEMPSRDGREERE